MRPSARTTWILDGMHDKTKIGLVHPCHKTGFNLETQDEKPSKPSSCQNDFTTKGILVIGTVKCFPRSLVPVVRD